jgi:5'-3' exonuclease
MALYSNLSKAELIKELLRKDTLLDNLMDEKQDWLDQEGKMKTAEEYQGLQSVMETGVEGLEWVLTYLYKGDTQSAIIHVDRVITEMKAEI